jgi:hypothetical protein
MREANTAPLIGWSRAFPATPAQVREARQFLTGILGGHPATDNAVLCLVREGRRAEWARPAGRRRAGPQLRAHGDGRAGWTVWFECG